MSNSPGDASELRALEEEMKDRNRDMELAEFQVSQARSAVEWSANAELKNDLAAASAAHIRTVIACMDVEDKIYRLKGKEWTPELVAERAEIRAKARSFGIDPAGGAAPKKSGCLGCFLAVFLAP